MNKNKLALELLNQSEVPYELQFRSEEDGNTYTLGWNPGNGLYGSYSDLIDIEQELKTAEIGQIEIY